MVYPMKHLLIVEPQAGGHRMHYVRHLVAGATRRGMRVTLATWPESFGHPAYEQLVAEHGGRFDTLSMSRRRMPDTLLRQGASFRQQRAFHRMFAEMFAALPASARPTHVIVPFLNLIDKVVPMLGSPFGGTPWSGIVMRDTFHHAEMGIPGRRRHSDRIKKWLFLRLAGNRHLQALFTIDQALPEYLARHYPSLRDRVIGLPDPVAMCGTVTRTSARAGLGFEDGQLVVLVFGVLNERKRLDALIAAMTLPSCPEQIVALAAGRQLDDTKALLATPTAQALIGAGRIVQVDGYLSAEQEYQAFAAADVVWVGYRDHFTMSGVLLQAGFMRLPAIACDQGLIGWLARRHRLGPCIRVDDPHEVAKALSDLAASAALREEYGSNGRRLAEAHDVTRFVDCIYQSIDA